MSCSPRTKTEVFQKSKMSNDNFKSVEIQHALDILSGIANNYSFKTDQQHLYKMLTTSTPTIEADGNTFVEFSLLSNFIQNFKHAIKTDDSSALMMERGLKCKMVDVIEFAESKEYFNQAGSLRPTIKYELNRLFHERYYLEAVLGGATSVGKNYFCEIALPYMLYQLSCYNSPQIEFDFAPGSPLFFIVQSVSMTLAKRVAFGTIAARIRLSPYFQKNFKFDQQIKSELRFPKDISVVPISGTDISALGMNVYAGVLDEINFRQRTANSIHTKYTGEEEYDQALKNYYVLSKRIKGRFMQKGKVPGKLLLVASANYTGDFIDRKVEEAKEDPTIFVMYYNQWDALRDEDGNLPVKKFSGEMFLIEKGSDIKSPRIIESREDAIDEDDVIEVPIEYKSDFEKDPIQSLKDYAGVGSGVMNPFIPQRSLIHKASESFNMFNEGRQLFRNETFCLNKMIDLNDPDWELVIDHEYLENIINPNVVYACHIDLSKNKDACGLSIGHIVDYERKEKITVYDKNIGDYREIEDVMVPIYMIDGALQITAPPGDEIDYDTIKYLVLYLKSHLYLKWCSMDVFQSVMMLQSFRKAKIKAGLQSVDTDIAPYAEVKAAIKDERIYYPDSEVLQRELRELEVDNIKQRVDHQVGSSKDVSDSVSGVVHLLFTKEAVQYLRPTRTRRASSGVRKVRLGEEGRSSKRRFIRSI